MFWTDVLSLMIVSDIFYLLKTVYDCNSDVFWTKDYFWLKVPTTLILSQLCTPYDTKKQMFLYDQRYVFLFTQLMKDESPIKCNKCFGIFCFLNVFTLQLNAGCPIQM